MGPQNETKQAVKARNHKLLRMTQRKASKQLKKALKRDERDKHIESKLRRAHNHCQLSHSRSSHTQRSYYME